MGLLPGGESGLPRRPVRAGANRRRQHPARGARCPRPGGSAGLRVSAAAGLRAWGSSLRRVCRPPGCPRVSSSAGLQVIRGLSAGMRVLRCAGPRVFCGLSAVVCGLSRTFERRGWRIELSGGKAA
eukprot:2455099-Pyramimonas_sp.AAC.1